MSSKLDVPIYKPGDIIEVKVVHIVNYGAFCEVPFTNPETGEIIKVKGLIHISEIFDYFVKNIEEFFSVNDIIEVEVLKYDLTAHQLKLSYKSIRPALLKNSTNKNVIVDRANNKGRGSFRPNSDYQGQKRFQKNPHQSQRSFQSNSEYKSRPKKPFVKSTD